MNTKILKYTWEQRWQLANSINEIANTLKQQHLLTATLEET